jgi:3-hydroxybutyryl-CoA dehydrogenase
MKIQKVGVLGCGLMGSGIAQVCAEAGYETTVLEVEQRFLDKGFSAIQKNLSRAVEKGKMTAEAQGQDLGFNQRDPETRGSEGVRSDH